MVQTETGANDLKTADNVEDALLLIKKYNPDIIISEMEMMGNTGVEILKYIKEKSLSSKTIILTDPSKQSNKTMCEQNGADCFLDKTTQLNYISHIIHQMAA